jgi:gliding motility-associated-like protein
MEDRLFNITAVFFMFLGFLANSSPADAQTFAKSYGVPSTNEGGIAVITSPDGGSFVGGYKADSALIMKVDPLGTVLWARTFKTNTLYSDVVLQLAITPDHQLIGCGNGYGGSPAITRATFFFKLDLNGNLAWIQTSSDVRPILAYSLLPRSSTEYVLVDEVYDMASPTFADPLSQGVSATNGSVLWTSPRYDYVPAHPYIDDIYSSVLGNGPYQYSTGRTYLSGSAPGGMRAFITKSDATGDLVFSRYYITSTANDARVYGADLLYDNDSLTMAYFGDIDQNSSVFRLGIIHTDSAGIVAWARYYDILDYSSEMTFKVLKMPYGYALAGYGTGATKDLFVLAVSNQGHLIWARGFGSSTEDDDLEVVYGKLATNAGSDILLTGQRITGSDTDILLYRMDATGALSCGEGYDLGVTVTDAPIFSASLNPQSSVETIAHGPVQAVEWITMNEDCSLSGDLLGNDTTTCSSLLLDATAVGGSAYLWQDGSTNATFTATDPGTYWVQASIGCCVARDTVIVSDFTDHADAFVPNVFTPNGDGLNERFGPVLSNPEGFQEMLIFNHWGNEIYATTSKLKPWDGRICDLAAPAGTYFYVVRWKDLCTGKDEEEQGHVTLLR